jgi:hypothetical protein
MSKVSTCSGEAAEFARPEIWWSTEFMTTSWRVAALLLFMTETSQPVQEPVSRGLKDDVVIHIAYI